MTSLVLNQEADSRYLAAALLGMASAALTIDTPKQFVEWTAAELQSLLPHRAMVAGIVEIERNRGAVVRKMVSRDFPPRLLEAAVASDGRLRCAIFAKWARERVPQLMDATQAVCGNVPEWVSAFQQTGLENIAAHGVRELGHSVATYFSFARIPGTLGERHAQTLKLVVPHMHLALARALAKSRRVTSALEQEPRAISVREQEVLRWLKLGKTNWEIAEILGVSQNTVKNEVRSILIKLRVNNRTRAVTKAEQLSII